jgi:hypothetical protein
MLIKMKQKKLLSFYRAKLDILVQIQQNLKVYIVIEI